MDFDQIFPIIIILIIWGIGAVTRKSPKDDQEDSAPVEQVPSLFKILQQGIAALEEKSQSDETLDLDQYIEPIPSAKPGKPAKRKESLIDMAERSAAKESIDISEEVDYISPSPDISPQSGTVSRKPGTAARINHGKLRNAVIWAEILAPPVAFRD